MNNTIFTIGHSNHLAEEFIHLITQNGIQTLVDVRSVPNSKWAPYTNSRELALILKRANIEYIYQGNILGGRPGDSSYLNEHTGKPNYGLMQEKPSFKQGIDFIISISEKNRVCIMCSEEDPSICHRNLLVGVSLRQRGVTVLHIRGNGDIQTDDDLWHQKSKVASSQLSFQL